MTRVATQQRRKPGSAYAGLSRRRTKTKQRKSEPRTYAQAGQPTKYQPAFVAQAEKLARFGATEFEIAQFFDVSLWTIRNWATAHEEFFKALKVGKEAADARVEQTLYRKATGYTFDSVKIFCNADGDVTRVQYVEHVPPDTTSCIFWLKNRRPQEWRDTRDLTNSDGSFKGFAAGAAFEAQELLRGANGQEVHPAH